MHKTSSHKSKMGNLAVNDSKQLWQLVHYLLACSDDLRFVRQTRVVWFYWVHVLVNALVLLLG